MATNNITDCSKCEFFGTSCITGQVPGSPKENGMLPKPEPTVTSCQMRNICEYTYGCYIKHSEGEILTSVIVLAILYASMCIYCCYILRTAFINKGKTRLDKLTFLTLVLFFALLARVFVVILKKEDYEKLSELYQTTIRKRKTQEKSRISKLPKEADARLEQLIEVAWTERQLNARLTEEIKELKEQIKNLLELNAELVKSNLHLIGSVRHSLDAQTRRQQAESSAEDI